MRHHDFSHLQFCGEKEGVAALHHLVGHIPKNEGEQDKRRHRWIFVKMMHRQIPPLLFRASNVQMEILRCHFMSLAFKAPT
jgi:hypothetical protein